MASLLDYNMSTAGQTLSAFMWHAFLRQFKTRSVGEMKYLQSYFQQIKSIN